MQTKLKRTDRIVSLLAGIGIATYSLLGGYDQIYVQSTMVGIGLMMAIGGICGT